VIPYQIDPSLHDGELPPESLEDGFSPPAPELDRKHERGGADAKTDTPGLGDKSPY
jgi:hypothetical protein